MLKTDDGVVCVSSYQSTFLRLGCNERGHNIIVECRESIVFISYNHCEISIFISLNHNKSTLRQNETQTQPSFLLCKYEFQSNLKLFIQCRINKKINTSFEYFLTFLKFFITLKITLEFFRNSKDAQFFSDDPQNTD